MGALKIEQTRDGDRMSEKGNSMTMLLSHPADA